ncbi:sacsin N-terminal ATP-binding-like domain-containing protein [Kribbella lupini]|uniref:sacsin N-terminal ATP-binding-like domain-containing protein n=1 Tax=Kribbella lupini TaxID=291602 RepID=UPI0031D2FB5B
MSEDFGSAEIRERVLAGWVAAPVRFREDANAEEDLALGGYLDRVVVELAQNAADAAVRAGVPGRVRFSLRDQTLVVANTGTPLTAAGVESLATLRASAKRDDDLERSGGDLRQLDPRAVAVGRFGVGFSAVLAVTDEPVILSRSGGVRFSRADTAAAVAALASDGLDLEVRRRDGQVPVLRLPFAAEGEPPAGFDTAVILPLRDDAARELVRRLLADAGDPLLLALPGLERIEIDVDGEERLLADVTERWTVRRAAGVLDEDARERLLADRPTEERARPYWSVLWALPRSADTDVPRTVFAPTPTDEALSLPVLLLATFPLDPSRRHVAKGPLTDHLVEKAAQAYARLLQTQAEAGVNVLPLVPTGLAAGALDGALRDEILKILPTTPLLQGLEPSELVRPRDAVVVPGVDEAFEVVLAPMVPGLVRERRQDRTALEALGVRRLDLAEVVDQLGAAGESPEWWRETYGALSGMVTDPLLREALGTLPVPLADGRLVRGVRGLLLPGRELPSDVLATFGEYGVRVVHPDAAHETLERLGALPATPRTLLEDSAVRTVVEHSADADDPELIAAAVLGVVAVDPSQADGLWWLSDLVLRDADGELVPANALVIPGSEAEAVLDADEVAPIHHDLLDRYGVEALGAVGVLSSLGVVAASDVVLDELPEVLADLDGIEDWADDVAPDGSRYGVTVGELVAVRDLDWITDDAWPRVLELFGTSPELRRALVDRPRVVGPDDRAYGVPSYAAWWIRERVLLEDGEPLAGRADPEVDPVLASLLDPAPEWTARLDPEVRTAVGLVRTVADLDVDGVGELLDRLADPRREIGESAILSLWQQLGTLTVFPDSAPEQVRVLGGPSEAEHARAGDAGESADAPDYARGSANAPDDARGSADAMDGGVADAPDGGFADAPEEVLSLVVAAGDAVVADAPMWLQREDLGGFVVAYGVVADGLSDLLEVPMAGEVAAGKVDGVGTAADVPAIVRELVPQVPDTWWEHEELTVDGIEVSWWVSEDGAPHAATFNGLAKALAWSAGRWDQRHVILAILSNPTRASELRIDATFDPPPAS